MNPLDCVIIPYSRSGSYLKIFRAPTGRLMIAGVKTHSVSKVGARQWSHDYTQIGVFRGKKELIYDWECEPGQVKLSFDGGSGKLAFLDSDTVGVSIKGAHLKLLPTKSVSSIQRPTKNSAVLHDYYGLCKQMYRAGRATTLAVEQTRTVYGETGPYDDVPYAMTFRSKGAAEGFVRISRFGEKWDDRLPAVSKAASEAHRDWMDFHQKAPKVADRYSGAAAFAWYLLWQLHVEADGNISYPCVFTSRRWLNKVWAWDSCFNAIAIAEVDLDMGLNMLRLFIEKQEPAGSFPDHLTNLDVQYTFSTAPIFGWAISQLIRRHSKKRLSAFLKKIYSALSRNTDWWFEYRDDNGNGFPSYLNAQESGWDKSSLFEERLPVEGADLTTYLILQMDTLAEIARYIGKRSEATAWKKRGQKLLDKLLGERVRSNRFYSPINGKKSNSKIDTIFNYMPLLLGNRVPEKIRKKAVAGLSEGGNLLRENGLLVQYYDHNLPKEEGLRFGPISPSLTYLIFNALLESNENGLAWTIADRFCQSCAEDARMWQYYHAHTGEGIRCPSYSSTASIFILLAQWLGQNE